MVIKGRHLWPVQGPCQCHKYTRLPPGKQLLFCKFKAFIIHRSPLLGDDTLNKPQEMSVSLAALKASYMIQVLQAIFRRNRETVAKMFSKHGVVFNFTCMDL
ncbi:hypothetical protein V6N11_009575 [Hibiscus sabdariffa]|uniref:Uncharacterized protein n=1 Tax=Hibiscus sabdariffa TaxID=183260 RepID=A0ABR2P6J5_9ROSI